MKIGVLGCGHVSRQYFEGLARYPHLEVIACTDLDSDLALRTAESNALLSLTPDELLASDVELVVNLTPPGHHYAESRRALEAGKHVYSEKPLALTTDEGRELVELASAQGLGVGCAPDTFLGPAIQTAVTLIREDAIGGPVAGVAFVSEHGYEHFHPNVSSFYEPGGGPALDLGPYYVTALVNMLGPVVAVTAAHKSHFPERTIGIGPRRGERIPVQVPTHVTGALEFASGALVTLLASWDIWSTHLPFLEIYGEDGSLSLPNPDLFSGPVRVRRAGPEELREPPPDPGELAWEPVPLKFDPDAQRGIGIADLVAALRDGREPRASGGLALHVLSVLEGLQRSGQQGQRVSVEHQVQPPPPLAADNRPEAFVA